MRKRPQPLCHTGLMRRLCPVRKGVARQPGGTQPPLSLILWQELMLLHSDEHSGMLRIGNPCRTSTFLHRQAGRGGGSTQMESGRLGDPQGCKQQPNFQRWWGRREDVFPGSTRGYPGVYSARKPLRPAGLKGRKDSVKRRGCSQILYFICLILQLYFIALTDHSYRDWKPFEKLAAETKGFKKTPLQFPSRLARLFQ